MSTSHQGGRLSAERQAGAILTAFARSLNGVDGALLASLDGRALAAQLPSHGHRQTAAIVASSLGLGSRLAELTGDGELHEIVVRSGTGYVVIYAVADNGALIVLTKPSVNLALLHVKSRGAVQQLGALVPAIEPEPIEA